MARASRADILQRQAEQLMREAQAERERQQMAEARKRAFEALDLAVKFNCIDYETVEKSCFRSLNECPEYLADVERRRVQAEKRRQTRELKKRQAELEAAQPEPDTSATAEGQSNY